ncbi:MAG: transcriptional regulator, LacI family [Nocardioides sp.]|nr:transcriptional regulator, LacI family [Nocardioides sp.]
MRVRLRDVAERAGVSVKTVSNVVNGYVHVAPSTRAHVQGVLDEMGYRPNLSARHLRAGRTGVIALALPELDNPYFAELTGFVVQAAEDNGWTVLVDQTDGLRERELFVAAGIRHHLIDGAILSPVALGAEDLVRRSPEDIPLVLLGEKISVGPVDHVAIDNVAAARLATEHLLSRGRTRPAAIGGQTGAESGVAHLRRRGWEDALTAAGLPVDESLVAEVPTFRREHGAEAMRTLLDRGPAPDAVFCFNDTLALGALRVLADRGLRVPEDVVVVGIDDVDDGRFAVPTLSTIAPDKEGIARTAVRMLAERFADGGADLSPRDVRAGFELIARESTMG